MSCTININLNYEAMPLASVEEWRARTGSSWCALGRPFKTSKSSGDYQSFAALSGNAMLQAVYALMVMVLALTWDSTVVFIRGIEHINGCINECQRQIKSELIWWCDQGIPAPSRACPSTSYLQGQRPQTTRIMIFMVDKHPAAIITRTLYLANYFVFRPVGMSILENIIGTELSLIQSLIPILFPMLSLFKHA